MEVAAQEIGSTRVRDEKGLATGDGEKRGREETHRKQAAPAVHRSCPGGVWSLYTFGKTNSVSTMNPGLPKQTSMP